MKQQFTVSLKARVPSWTVEAKRWVAMAGLAICFLFPWGARAGGFFLDTGDILTANYLGNKVVKINSRTGAQQSLGNFVAPTALALGPTGDLYVGELGGAIKRLTFTNGVITRVNPGSCLTSVRGLTLGSAGGDLFVTGRSNSTDVVMRLNLVTGVETLLTRGNQLALPTGIAWLDANHLVVASFLNSKIVKIRILDGNQTVIVSGGVWIDRPWGVAVAGELIYAGHYDSKHINKIMAGTGTSALLGVAPGFPYGIGLEADGNLLVGVVGAAGQQDMLVRFSPQGALLTAFNIGVRQQISDIKVAPFRIELPAPCLRLTDLGDSSCRLQLEGVPGRTYQIEYTDCLSPLNWQTLGSGTADTAGNFEFIDKTRAGAPERYYRSVTP